MICEVSATKDFSIILSVKISCSNQDDMTLTQWRQILTEVENQLVSVPVDTMEFLIKEAIEKNGHIEDQAIKGYILRGVHKAKIIHDIETGYIDVQSFTLA